MLAGHSFLVHRYAPVGQIISQRNSTELKDSNLFDQSIGRPKPVLQSNVRIELEILSFAGNLFDAHRLIGRLQSWIRHPYVFMDDGCQSRDLFKEYALRRSYLVSRTGSCYDGCCRSFGRRGVEVLMVFAEFAASRPTMLVCE